MKVDRREAERIYDEASGPVHAYLSAVCQNREQRDEVFQETFLRVFEASKRIREPRRYALRCARNLLLSRKDRTQSAESELAAPGLGVAERLAVDSELEAALARIRPERRLVFLLRHRAGLSYEEIAELCELAPGTVASRMHHAIQELRKLLGPRIGVES